MEPAAKKQKISAIGDSSSSEAAKDASSSNSGVVATVGGIGGSELPEFPAGNKMIKFDDGTQAYFLHAPIGCHHSPVLKEIVDAGNDSDDIYIYYNDNGDLYSCIYAHAMHWFYTQSFQTGVRAPSVDELYQLGDFAACLKIVKLHNQIVDVIVGRIKDSEVLYFKFASFARFSSDPLARLFHRHCAIMLESGAWTLPTCQPKGVKSWYFLRRVSMQLVEMLKEENNERSLVLSSKYHVLSELGFKENLV